MSGDPPGPALCGALAGELVALTGALSALALELGQDIEILRRHMTALQDLDRISQVQLAVAGVLCAGGSDGDRISGVAIEALAGRLRAAVEGGPAVRAGPISANLDQ